MRLAALLLIAASAALVSARELRGGSGVQSGVVLLEMEVEASSRDTALSATANATADDVSTGNATADDVSTGNATADDVSTGNATAPAPTSAPSKTTEQKEGMTKAKINAYMRKIKLFQRLKKQRWDPIVEEELAQHLVMLDDIMQVTPEEKEIETKLRKKQNGYGVEISLNRRSQERSTERREKRGEKRALRKSSFADRRKKRAMAREELQTRKVLARYKKLGVPKELKMKHMKAQQQYKMAVHEEKSKKNDHHYKKFAREYGIGGQTPGTGKPDESDAPEGDAPQPAAAGAKQIRSTVPNDAHELGEDANKHTSQDHIMVMPIQKVQLEQDALGQLEEDSSAAQATQADKLDDSLSDAALQKIHDSDSMLVANP